MNSHHRSFEQLTWHAAPSAKDKAPPPLDDSRRLLHPFYYWGDIRGVTLMLDADRPRTPQQADDTYKRG